MGGNIKKGQYITIEKGMSTFSQELFGFFVVAGATSHVVSLTDSLALAE